MTYPHSPNDKPSDPTPRRLIRSGLLAWALWSSAAGAAGLNRLEDLQVRPTASGAEVVVTGSQAPTFTVFRLNDPDRLVVDLSSADATAVKGHRDGTGPISGVVTSQFADERSHVGRVLVALGDVAQYDVRADGNKLLIAVKGNHPVAAAPKALAALDKLPEPAPVAAAPAPPAKSDKPENVVASAADEQAVKHPARHVTGLRLHHDTLTISTDGDVAHYELLELTDPPRLALDLYGVGLTAKAPKAGSALLKEVRAGAHADKVRLVLDVRGEMPAYRAVRKPHELQVVLSERPATAAAPLAPAASPAHVATPSGGDAVVEIDGQRISLDGPEQPAATPPAPVAAPRKLAELEDIKFDESASGGKLILKMSGTSEFKVDRPDEHSAVLTLENARLPKRLERSLDTSALGTPVKMVSAFAVPGKEGRVRVVVAAEGNLSEEVSTQAQSGGLVWRLSSDKKATTAEVAASAPRTAGDVAVSASAPKTAGFASEAPAYAEENAPRQGHPKYTGRLVSFEFKDIDIQNLLRVIAEVSRKNVIVADDVTGKVTIRLRNVPWDQALDLILRSKSLGKEEMGNIIRVAPLHQLEEEAKAREERRKSQIRQEELVVQLIPVNYATAGEMSSRVKDVLSERGSVSVDTRTNVLIVRDVASNINRARSMVQSLDTQTPQVLIESRIVEASTNFARQIGVQWGGTGQLAPATGNATGLQFPNTFGVQGGVAGTSPGAPAAPNYAVNLPAAVGQGSGGALGFIFGSAGGAVGLNLRLSALENEGAVKTISAPKVTTLDNITAKISQGLSIPFSQVSAAGVNTTFIEARLSLEVTPHITLDGSVLMNIRAENNQPDPSNTGANGQPAIQRKEASTQVLVKDGDTTVIGGIYVRRGSTQVSMVPFLGRIPILGFFFKNNNDTETRQELLIFITPRILNRQTVAQTL